MRVDMFRSLCAATLLAFAGQANAELIVTGVFDGGLPGGEPKVVELFAKADIADLSAFGVGAANNGGGTDGVELVLSGSASMGDFIYIVDDDGQGALGAGFASYFGFTPALIFDGTFANGGAASINGDDAIEVFGSVTVDDMGTPDPADDVATGTVIDVFGDINVDGSGQPWEYLDGWAYRNDATGPDGSTFVIGNWTFSGINVTDGTSTNAEVDPSFPIGTYTMIPEPGTVVLALLAGVMGLAARMRRTLG